MRGGLAPGSALALFYACAQFHDYVDGPMLCLSRPASACGPCVISGAHRRSTMAGCGSWAGYSLSYGLRTIP